MSILKKLITTTVIVFFGILIGYQIANQNYEVPLPKNKQVDESDDKWYNNCQYLQRISDTDGDGREDVISFCEDRIVISFRGSIPSSFYKNNEDVYGKKIHIIESTETFPELFNPQISSTTSSRVPHSIEVHDLGELGHLLILRAEACWGTGCFGETAVHLIKDKSTERIFKFRTRGRSSKVTLYSNNPLILKTDFISGSLGCGSCFYYWINMYKWNSTIEEFELANDQFSQEFKELLSDYKRMDEHCDSISGPSISKLWNERKGENPYCYDNATAPAITSKQAEHFLKSKRIIERILAGENLSDKNAESARND